MQDLRSALAKILLEGEHELDELSVGALRRRVAEQLGLGEEGLNDRAQEVSQMTEAIVGELSGWWQPESVRAGEPHEVFLVTFAPVLAATAAAVPNPLRVLDAVKREDIRDALLEVVASHANAGRGRPSTTPAVVLKMAVFLEENPKHFHVAVRFSKRVRFLPYKDALRARHGLASHWSRYSSCERNSPMVLRIT